MKRMIVTLLIAPFLFSSVGYARTKITVAGVLSKGIVDKTIDAGTAATTSITYKGGIGRGAGLMAEFGDVKWGFELGAFFHQQGLEITTKINDLPPLTGKGTINKLYIPAGVRLYLGSLVSLGAGGFFDKTLETGGGSNYGIHGGLRIGKTFFVEPRLNYYLKDEPKFPEIMALVGVSF